MSRSRLLRSCAVLGVFALGACSSGGGTDPGGGITLTISAGSLNVIQGAVQNLVATIGRTGDFDGAVTISIVGLPANVTASANPASIPSGSTTSTITFTVAAGATPATTTVTIRASGSGVDARTQNVALTITAGGGGNTTFRVCTTMLFAAYQDGTGPWTPATVNPDNPTNGSSITFNLASGRGAVAYVVSFSATSYSVNYTYATQAELNSGAGACAQPPVTKTINGSVANLGVSDFADVALGTSEEAFVFPATGLNFTLFQVPNIAVDLIATRNLLANTVGSINWTSNKIIVRRNQNPANLTTLPVLDFNAAEAVTPETRTLTVNNLGSDVLGLSLTYGSHLAAGASTSVVLFLDSPGSNAGTFLHPVHPAPGQNDMHGYNLFTTPVAGATRSLFAYYREGQNRTVNLGAALGAVNVTTAATVPPRLRVQYTTQADYNWWAVNYQQDAGGTVRFYNVSVTAGYQGASATLDHTMPDLSALTGWNAIWNLVTGQQIQWGFTGTGGSVTGVIDGSVMIWASRTGTITP